MKLKFKSWFIQNKYYFLILATVLIFFYPIFKGQIPFPGDLLVNENPYKEESYFGYGPLSFPNKAQGADVIKEIYPWQYFSIQSLKNGEIPFWNPHNFSGNPQLANFQTGLFDPFNFLYFIFPINISWTVQIVLQPFLAAAFMFLFLSKSLKLSKFASFIGGITFAFSSYMTVWTEYGNIAATLLWLPLILFFTKRIVDKVTAYNFLGLILSITLSLLSGYIQGLFYIYIISFLYFIFNSNKRSIKKLLIFLSALFLPIIFCSFQILPTLQLFTLSTRGQYSLDNISNLLLPPFYWITFFASDFFGNPATRNYYVQGTYIERVMYVGVPLILFAWFALKSKFKEKKFFVLGALISLIIATNFPFVKYLYLLPIPVISTTVPTRELSVFIFFVIVLAAFGINFWEKINKKTKIPYLFLFVYLLIWISSILLNKYGVLNSVDFKVAVRNLILPTSLAIFTFLIFRSNKNLSKMFLTLLLVIDLLYFFNKITPFSDQQLIYPKTSVVSFIKSDAGINRFWGYGSGYISPNFQSVDGTFSPEGNDPLHLASYGKLLASSSDGKLPEVLPRPDANIAPGFGTKDLKDNFFRKRILDLLGVKYIIHKNENDNEDLETFPRDSYKLIWSDKPLQVYENKNSLPRFFIANDYKIYSNKDEVLKGIYDKNIDLGKTMLL